MQDVPQEAIVARLTGRPQDRPAYTGEVVVLLHSFGVPAAQTHRPRTPQELYTTLMRGNMIVALVRPGGGMQGDLAVFEG